MAKIRQTELPGDNPGTIFLQKLQWKKWKD
jgi:hypothetical protein